MSMMDHYPTKKRRLVLNKKMSTRSKPALKDANPVNDLNTSEVILPSKKHKGSPGNISADDSQVEIHWDNNSPSPSQALKPRRKGRTSRKNKANDLSSLIKQIPKTRKSDVVDTTTTNNDNAFTTWMQQNLASSSTTQVAGYSLRQNVARSSLGRGTKEEALDFSEKVKQFLSQAPIAINTQRFSPNNLRSSPTIMTRSQRSQTASPSYFSNSSNDSFLINFDNNSDDSILGELDQICAPSSKTPVRGCRLKKINKTPKVRSARKQPKRPIPKLNSTPSNKKMNFAKNRSPVNDDYVNVKHTQGLTRNVQQLPTLTEIVKTENLIDIDFDDNDEVDEILATQPDIFEQKKHIATTEVSLATKTYATKRKQTSTPMATRTKETIKTPDLLVDNINDDFDDILANFDIDEVRCKSQDTPARLTSDQRKMKTKCHTSPLPLNNCYKHKLDTTKAFKPISREEPAWLSSSAKKLDNKLKTLSIRSPGNAKKTDFKAKCIRTLPTVSESQQSSFVKTGMVTTACRKPFVPPKKNAANSSFTRFPLEISAISGKVGESEAVKSSAIQDSSSFNQFSSTQKCTMQEIEEKRKYAQLKLRERLRRKRTK